MPWRAGLISLVTILALCQRPVHAGRATDAIADLHANHRGFELRDAVRRAADAPALYRAAVACEFHAATCEREMRTAVGGFRLKSVAFLVFRDDQQPFSDLPPGHRGAIGLPVLLAFGTFSWGADNQFRIGPAGAVQANANLCFDGLMPVVRRWRQSTALSFNLDTGAEETMLWPPFAREFADVTASGKQGATTVAGVGGSVEAESVEVPRVEFALGGQPVVLTQVSVLHPTTADTRRRFGNVGLDVLNQARQTVISFESMSLTLVRR